MSERLNKFLASIPDKLGKATVADIDEMRRDKAALVAARDAVENLVRLAGHGPNPRPADAATAPKA